MIATQASRAAPVRSRPEETSEAVRFLAFAVLHFEASYPRSPCHLARDVLKAGSSLWRDRHCKDPFCAIQNGNLSLRRRIDPSKQPFGLASCFRLSRYCRVSEARPKTALEQSVVHPFSTTAVPASRKRSSSNLSITLITKWLVR